MNTGEQTEGETDDQPNREKKTEGRCRMSANFPLSPSGILVFKLPFFIFSLQTILMGGCGGDKDNSKPKMPVSEKRKSDEGEQMKDLKKVRRTLIELRNCQMETENCNGY